MQIQKKPGSLLVMLASPGGRLARLSMTPSQAKAVGEVLKNTGEYYNKQMKNKEPNAEDMVSAGDYRVYFSSSRGMKFQVSVRKSAVGAAVLMSKDQALKMGKYLGDAEEMAALVVGLREESVREQVYFTCQLKKGEDHENKSQGQAYPVSSACLRAYHWVLCPGSYAGRCR